MAVPEIKYEKCSINTRRLIIRPLVASDFDMWFRANKDALPSQNRFDPGKRPDETRIKRIFKSLISTRRLTWKNDRFYAMGIFEKKTGLLVGIVNVIPHARTIIQTAAIGYAISNRHWRKGYATEAVKAVTMFAFNRLKFHRLTAEIDVTNKGSVGLIKKLGYRKEARANKLIFESGQWHDCYIFSTTAEHWGIKNSKPVYRQTSAES